MSLTSISFYLLFIGTILLLLLAQKFAKEKIVPLRKGILLASSFLFCGWQNWKFPVIVLLECILIWYCAIALEKQKRRWLLAICVGIVVAFLGLFKYYNFFADTFSFFGIPMKRTNLILPLGISFYSFSAIGYIVDVYQGKMQAARNFFDVCLYMFFFPKMTAGPIISAGDFIKQIYESHLSYSIQNVSEGIQMIMMGLIKKNVLADHICVFTDSVYKHVDIYNAPTLLLAVFSYGFQIYLDFSGYSDIAIGCARCLGYQMPQNFNLPYIAQNVTEFWKRWHITLSQWLMRYIYIPLGGNRHGYIRQLINLMLTMMIGGLWHGASWNFVIWGTVHGLFLCLHKQYRRVRKLPKDYKPGIPAFLLSAFATMAVADFCWIFFRITDMRVIGTMLLSIITWKDGVAFYSVWAIIGLAACLIGILITAACVWKRDGKAYDYTKISGFYVIRDLTKFGNMVLFFVIAGLIFGLVYAYSNPFIYAAF